MAFFVYIVSLYETTWAHDKTLISDDRGMRINCLTLISIMINEMIDLKTAQVSLLSASLFTLKGHSNKTFLFCQMLPLHVRVRQNNDLLALTECSSVLLNWNCTNWCLTWLPSWSPPPCLTLLLPSSSTSKISEDSVLWCFNENDSVCVKGSSDTSDITAVLSQSFAVLVEQSTEQWTHRLHDCSLDGYLKSFFNYWDYLGVFGCIQWTYF